MPEHRVEAPRLAVPTLGSDARAFLSVENISKVYRVGEHDIYVTAKSHVRLVWT